MARNRKKIGTDLYLDCSFTFKFPAVANNFSRDIVVEFFINALRLADFWLPRAENSKIFPFCREFDAFSLTFCE